jgi:hypothetical protein
MLSFYYHRLSLSEGGANSEEHKRWHEESIRNLNNADNIFLGSAETFVTKIYYMISQGQLSQAQQYLENLKSL